MNETDILQQASVLPWIYLNEIKTEDGLPYSFENHIFMFDPLNDMGEMKKDIVCMKAAQIGFSTAALLVTLWIAKMKGVNIIYTLPTADDVRQFSGGKINRMISQNPILKDWIKDKDTVEQKTIGNSIIYYRGSFMQKAAMMISSELNVYDEIDASDQAVIEQYSTRLQAAKIKGIEPREWFFSHPSAPGIGVSKQWEFSDKRHWFITCPECKDEHYMDFPESFDLDKKKYVCRNCKAEVTNETRRKGRWKPTDKGEKIGYWIPLWLAPWVTAKTVIKYKEEKSPEYFDNKVKGVPYIGGGNKLTKPMFEGCLTDDILQPTDDGQIVIGLDTGIINYYVVGTANGLFFYDKCEGYDPIEDLLNRYKKAICIIDQGGDLRKPRELKEKYAGRIFLAQFTPDRKSLELVRYGKKGEQGNILADRNRLIQLVVDEFRDQKIQVQGKMHEWEKYYKHWNNLTRMPEIDTVTGERKQSKWIRSGDDHWALATAYWRIGVERSGEAEIITYEPIISEFGLEDITDWRL